MSDRVELPYEALAPAPIEADADFATSSRWAVSCSGAAGRARRVGRAAPAQARRRSHRSRAADRPLFSRDLVYHRDDGTNRDRRLGRSGLEELERRIRQAATRHPLVDKVLAGPPHRARYLTLLASLSDPMHGLFSDARWSALFAAQAPLYAPQLDIAADEGELMEDTGTVHAYFPRRLAVVRARLAVLYTWRV